MPKWKKMSSAYIRTKRGYRKIRTDEFWLKTKDGYKKVKGKLVTE